jgi:ubiquinone/menaquinone biosynthesis C-methylase UbiE
VLVFNVLEHVYHHRQAIHELSRVLKPEGKLIGFVPFLINIHADPFDYYRYTPETITLLLKEFGFVNIKIKTLTGAPILFAEFCNKLPVLWRFSSYLQFFARYLSNIINKQESNLAKLNRNFVLAIFFTADKIID